eukprot:SAG31_NODE_985_length_10549_cov_2.605339_1_plen_95_part_00
MDQSNKNHDYYRESQFNGKWIPMTKKEIMEYCDIQIQNYNILKEENERLKLWANKVIKKLSPGDKEDFIKSGLINRCPCTPCNVSGDPLTPNLS